MTDVPPDAVYVCDCGESFPDDQIAYEQHLAREHGRLRDTLPSVRHEL